jgi:3-oxoacyl-[acyl-carrier-protein] synthase II
VRIAGEVKDFDPRASLSAKEAGRLDRFVHYAAAAADEALRESLIRLTPRLARRTAVVIGSSRGGIGTWEENVSGLLSRGFKGVSPFAAPMSLVNMAAGFIALKHGITGPTLAVSTACLRPRPGGSDDPRQDRGRRVAGSARRHRSFDAGRLCRAVFAPQRRPGASPLRPDARRVCSPRAGIVVLESADRPAPRRSWPVAGYGTTNDAYTRPAGDRRGGGDRSALADAGGREVDCVIATGPRRGRMTAWNGAIQVGPGAAPAGPVVAQSLGHLLAPLQPWRRSRRDDHPSGLSPDNQSSKPRSRIRLDYVAKALARWTI